LKIKLSREARGIVIPRVELSGPKGSLQVDLLLDTGAVYTLISWDTAMALGYDPAHQRKSLPIVTANGKIHVPQIRISKISIQDISAKNVPVICHDIPELIEAAGLLGLSFLRSFRTIIDYRSLTIDIR
jgi:clan AA aspartic protease (TIGR02281 family)